MADWKEQSTELKRQAGFDYNRTAFMLKRPYEATIVQGPMRLTKSSHKELIETALKKGLHVWYADVIEKDGKKYLSSQHVVDFDSVPNQNEDGTPNQSQDQLICSICKKQCSSTSGYTLHMKSHEGKAAEVSSTTGADKKPLVCQVCGQGCSSTSGLTLHMKKHQPQPSM
jgi:hypothetical protein